MSTTGRWGRGFLLGFAIAALAGCGGSGEGLDENGRPVDEAPPDNGGGNGNGAFEPTIEAIQANVFTPRCTECHAGALAPQGLRLTDAQTSYSMLVGVHSSEQSQLFRVEAGNPDASYLIHKLEGTQESGQRMPRGGPFLDQATIDVVRQWISDGAPPPAAEGFGGFILQGAP